MVRLHGEPAGSGAWRAFTAWQEAHPEHAAAWRHLQAWQLRLAGLPAGAAQTALDAAHARGHSGRRRLLLSLGAGSAGLAALQGLPLARAMLADVRTGVGERHELRLPDGSQLSLNTDTAVDVGGQAGSLVVRLHRGEILVRAGALLTVAASEGQVRATPDGEARIQRLDHTLAVTAHRDQVAVQPRMAVQTTPLPTGRCVHIDAQSVSAESPADFDRAAWAEGLLVARGRRLDAFLADLARYRHGYLGVAPEIGGLRISGVFPLADPDRVLAALARTLAVRLQYRTRYWVRVLPA
ncbi:FecR family protein [Verticiella sediminum]